MNKEKQIDIIIDLLTEFDEMGFVPTTTVPDPEAYAIKWRAEITKALEDYFAADVVEVVRCKDCIHRNPMGEKCLKDGIWHGLDGFCNFGKRKTDGT